MAAPKSKLNVGGSIEYLKRRDKRRQELMDTPGRSEEAKAKRREAYEMDDEDYGGDYMMWRFKSAFPGANRGRRNPGFDRGSKAWTIQQEQARRRRMENRTAREAAKALAERD